MRGREDEKSGEERVREERTDGRRGEAKTKILSVCALSARVSPPGFT